MTKDEVLERLRVLRRLERPVWLAGGVAADFHVGRWTRDHHDIDLVTFEEHRSGLHGELIGLGFICTGDRGWITNWTNAGQDPGEVSLADERRLDDSTGARTRDSSARSAHRTARPWWSCCHATTTRI